MGRLIWPNINNNSGISMCNGYLILIFVDMHKHTLHSSKNTRNTVVTSSFLKPSLHMQRKTL